MLKELRKHILALAKLSPTPDRVVSCYLNCEVVGSNVRRSPEEQFEQLTKSLPHESQLGLAESFSLIETHLRQGVPDYILGVAIFARTGIEPFFLPLHFHAPLPTSLAVDAAPCVYNLLEFQDTYDRYAVAFCSESGVQLVGLNVGTVVHDIWKKFPKPRDRTSRSWSKEKFQHDRQQQIGSFVGDLIADLNQLMFVGGYKHLVLAGSPRITSKIRKALPNHVASKLVDVIPASEDDRVRDVITATLESFVDQEEHESQIVVERLQREIDTHGLAVVGTAATFEALKWGQVEVLVLAKAYDLATGWGCDSCGAERVQHSTLRICAECLCPNIRDLNVKEEMVRMAVRTGCRVEVVNESDALMGFGGIGCLLRFLGPERYQARAA